MMTSAPPTVYASGPNVAPFTKPRRPIFAIVISSRSDLFLYPENVGAFPASQQDRTVGGRLSRYFGERPPCVGADHGSWRCLSKSGHQLKYGGCGRSDQRNH